SAAGFRRAVVRDLNVGGRLAFELDNTTSKHAVIWETNSVCPGSRGAEPCWPDLNFDDGQRNCIGPNGRVPGYRCLIVEEPGVTVRYHDASNTANGGEISVL